MLVLCQGSLGTLQHQEILPEANIYLSFKEALHSIRKGLIGEDTPKLQSSLRFGCLLHF